MDILNQHVTRQSIKSHEIEQVQQEKTEYTHMGTYLRNKSLKLFYYNPMTCTVHHVDIVRSNTLHLCLVNGKPTAVDLEYEKAFVDTRMIFFEAMSLTTAKVRVEKWQQGRIKELFNLREQGKNMFNFFN